MAETLPDSINQIRDYAEVRGLVHLRNYDDAHKFAYYGRVNIISFCYLNYTFWTLV